MSSELGDTVSRVDEEEGTEETVECEASETASSLLRSPKEPFFSKQARAASVGLGAAEESRRDC